MIVEATLGKNDSVRTASLHANSLVLLSALRTLTERVGPKSESLAHAKEVTVVGLMLGRKMKSASRNQFVLVLALAVHLAVHFFNQFHVSNFRSVPVGLTMFAIYADQKLIELRIKKGWYGRNRFETLELVSFMMDYPDKDDFGDGEGYKRILPSVLNWKTLKKNAT